jgi:hypothetical protein
VSRLEQWPTLIRRPVTLFDTGGLTQSVVHLKVLYYFWFTPVLQQSPALHDFAQPDFTTGSGTAVAQWTVVSTAMDRIA